MMGLLDAEAPQTALHKAAHFKHKVENCEIFASIMILYSHSLNMIVLVPLEITLHVLFFYGLGGKPQIWFDIHVGWSNTWLCIIVLPNYNSL